jgi:hypothetical protein
MKYNENKRKKTIDFKKISGSPIGYFLNSRALDVFEKCKSITEFCEIKKGISN